MKKASKSKEKSTKSVNTFCKNKPNSPIVQTNVTNLITMIYTIFAGLTKVKNKPNQSQYKPNSNPISERPKMNVRNAIKKGYENISRWPVTKTKPKQTQFKFILECRSRGANLRKAKIFQDDYGLVSFFSGIIQISATWAPLSPSAHTQVSFNLPSLVASFGIENLLTGVFPVLIISWI